MTINQGDSIQWSGLKEFHTVDFPANGGADLPLFVHGATVTGVNDFAGNPFWFDGTKPSVEFDPQLGGPIGGKTYNGSSRVDSGASGASDTFKLKFTKPGVYKYYCDIHPGMIGYVIVKPKGKSIPSARQTAAAVTAQLTGEILAARKLAHTKPPANTVDLGAGAPGIALYRFFPATLNVKAGTVVTFRVPPGEQTEGHTASFGPKAYLAALSNSSTDASTQETAYPSSNPADGPIQLSPSSHGNGFANTGILDQDPSSFLPATEKITFTTPGTYHFYCLIHPFMSARSSCTDARAPSRLARQMLELDTPHGPAHAHPHLIEGGRGALVLGHGAGGGVSAPDLVAATSAAHEAGYSVVLVEQPYRVAGRRSPAPAAHLDAAWLSVIEQLREGPLAGLPLIIGGRSAGARVACRTATRAGAAAVLCLAFPVHPPGKEDDPLKSRLYELDAVAAPVLVVQGERATRSGPRRRRRDGRSRGCREITRCGRPTRSRERSSNGSRH